MESSQGKPIDNFEEQLDLEMSLNEAKKQIWKSREEEEMELFNINGFKVSQELLDSKKTNDSPLGKFVI